MECCPLRIRNTVCEEKGRNRPILEKFWYNGLKRTDNVCNEDAFEENWETRDIMATMRKRKACE